MIMKISVGHELPAQRDRQTERERKRDRQTDRETEGHRQTDRQTDAHTQARRPRDVFSLLKDTDLIPGGTIRPKDYF